MIKIPLRIKTNRGFNYGNLAKFEIWTKMAIKYKPQGLGCKKFEIWTKMAKVPKPKGSKWQFTLYYIIFKNLFMAIKIFNSKI
ncbi:hypothetical protein Hanom_Chr10g00931211 [Helianthus anomalus]